MRKTLALILSVLVIQAILIVASRYVTDSWYLYLLNAVQLQVSVALVAGALIILLLSRTIVSWLILAASIALTISAYVMLGEFAQTPSANAKPILKMITFNVLGSNSKNGSAIADMLVASDADVLFIQESAALGPQIPKIRALYPYRMGCGALTMTCDLSLWSKRPLIDGVVKTISPLYRDRFMTAVIDVDGTKIRLVNAHMAKPYFDETHAVELKNLGEKIAEMAEPLVLAGDFNASILAPDVQRMLRKTGLRSAGHEPQTWPVQAPQLGVAIDHVFVRAPLEIAAIARLSSNYGSNHFGLKASLSLKPVADQN